MLLFYIRHGEPVYENPDNLTVLGQKQVDAVTKRMALCKIDKIFASTSQRAIKTAAPLSKLLKKDITLLDFCNESYVWKEFAFPNKQGVHDWAFRNDKIMDLLVSSEVYQLGSRWYDHPRLKEYGFQKGIERVDRGVDEFLLLLGYAHDREKHVYHPVAPSNQRVALFAHQGFSINFMSSLLDIPYPLYGAHFDLVHTGMTVIEFKEGDDPVIPRVWTLSNDSHLYKEGLPTAIHGPVCE